MKKLLIGFVLLFSQLTLMAQRSQNFIQYVNPLIGTQKMRHTFPGATVIVGFSHTHFSGTGHSDLGNFLIMPTVGELQLEPGDKNNPKSCFRSKFSHTNETAEPNYYTVLLSGKEINRHYITHSEIINGGKLAFEMSNKPKV